MTKAHYSHITLVCDRSGSMHAICTDAQGAVNSFITKEKEVPGEASLLLVEFDAQIGHAVNETPEWYNIVFDGNLADAPMYKLRPRGNTALHDAVGRAITETGLKLEKMPEHERPEHVFFVVQTDGAENSSRDFTAESVKKMVKTQTDEFRWDFVFLGTGPETWGQGAQMGFGNVTRSASGAQSFAATYDHTHQVMANVRTGRAKSMSGSNATVDSAGNVVQDAPDSEDHKHDVT
jgi:hypothetical protein